MLKEFRDFAFKGNLVDMSVGIIIGGAFGTVVKSLVDDIFMPLFGLLTQGADFSQRYLVLKGEVPPGTALETAKTLPDVNLLTYGNFITAFISFLIVAFVLFLLIKKFMAALQKKETPVEAAPAKPSPEVILLEEIRDLLAKK
jgi:large conductance mechanosensitive channel